MAMPNLDWQKNYEAEELAFIQTLKLRKIESID